MLVGSVAAGSGGPIDDSSSNGGSQGMNMSMPHDQNGGTGGRSAGGSGGGNARMNADAGMGNGPSGNGNGPSGNGPTKGGMCAGGSSPVAETCDNADNDCDGKVDEDVERSCGSSMVGLCHLGKQTCNAGSWGACEGSVEPAQEVCDAAEQDENCDGAANEGCACTPGMTKMCGKTVGSCVMGMQTCTNDGTWGSECAGEVQPMPEVCDGKQDEDCDGLADDADMDCECIDGMMAPCVAGMGLCADGMKMCSGGKWGACKGPAPKKELCDGKGLDEDCDGTPDNGCVCTDGMMRACPNGTDTGECSAGMQTCSGGQWGMCTGNQGPTTEKCDGKDSNCNGTSDDDEPSLCAGGKPCVQNGSTWGCAKCTAATVKQDCSGASACKTPSCTAAGQCQLDNVADLTFCPGSSTHEGYCRSGTCSAPRDGSGRSPMPGGSALYPGEKLSSPGGTFELEYQSDGNVTLWTHARANSGDFVWCLFNTSKSTDGGALVMQPDGDFVLWNRSNYLWDTGTGGQPDSRITVNVTDTGHVYLKDRYGSPVYEVIGDYKGNVQAN